jgi:hypothetical protein
MKKILLTSDEDFEEKEPVKESTIESPEKSGNENLWIWYLVVLVLGAIILYMHSKNSQDGN